MSKILKRFLEEILHSDLGNVQGGRKDEHYHMTYEEWAKLPVRPYIVSPEDGAENVNQVPQIVGSKYVHPYNLPMHGREIQIATDAEFENIVYELPTEPESERFSESTTFQIFLKPDETSYFEPATTYYVRIRYQDRNMKWSGWSDVSRFTTMAEFPDNVLIAPQMIIPPDGGIVRAKDPILAMSAAQVAAGVATFDRADWQIAHSPTFADDAILYQALETDALTLHQTSNLSLSSALGSEFYARGRQWPVGETDGTKVPWTPYVSFGIRPDYDKPVFGLRKLFSKKYGVPFVWNIDEEGNIVSIPQRYWNEHPLYAALDEKNVKEVPVVDDITSSMVLVPPCWMKYRVYDNADGDMVIDTWYSPTPQTGDGWRLDMAFTNNENGFYLDTCLGASNETCYFSQYDVPAESLHPDNAIAMLRKTQALDVALHLWTIYERRLILDLMVSEYATLDPLQISVGYGKNNDSLSFCWRAFRGLILIAYNNNASNSSDVLRPIVLTGIKRTVQNGFITKIQVMTPDGGNWMPYDASVKISNAAYASDILKGESDEMGFDVALLGIVSASEDANGRTTSPFGMSPSLTTYSPYSDIFCCAQKQDGIFGLSGFDGNYNTYRYVRMARDYV